MKSEGCGLHFVHFALFILKLGRLPRVTMYQCAGEVLGNSKRSDLHPSEVSGGPGHHAVANVNNGKGQLRFPFIRGRNQENFIKKSTL